MSTQNPSQTRWWWIRHAPVPDGGCIYGQRDLDCDCSDVEVFRAVARALPRDAVWFTSSLLGAGETAGEPNRIPRQLAGNGTEDREVAAITVEVALAVDATVVGHRRVADPPPARLAWALCAHCITTTILPIALRAASRAMASPALGRL